MELWDAYDASFTKIQDLTLVRGEAIPEGVYHLVCDIGVYHLVYDILVKHIDGTYLLMKRDLRKPFGGMWEATAGGSALVGENPLQCAIRELTEETGIISNELFELGTQISHDTIYVEFLCVTDWEKENVTIQEGETIAFRWVSSDKLRSMKKDELVTERMQKFVKELN